MILFLINNLSDSSSVSEFSGGLFRTVVMYQDERSKSTGSSGQGVFVLVLKEYAKLVFVSISVAVPLVWYFTRGWIESFPYRTTISPMIFVISGFTVLLISLLTVSFQTIKAARQIR